MCYETEAPDWRKEMMEKYSDIFRERNLPMTQTCMCWGLEVGDGWKGLLEKLCSGAQFIYEQTGVLLVANQVKEKFGTLRFYHSLQAPDGMPKETARGWYEILSSLVADAERRSAYVCETCGDHGELRGTGWLSVTCYRHANPDELDEHDAAKRKEYDNQQKEKNESVQTAGSDTGA